MRTVLFSFFGIGLLLGSGPSGHGQSSSNTATKDVMKFKLHFAQGVLEGIATENYDLIETNAVKLKSLSQQVEWQLRQTPEYQRLTADFTSRVDALAKAARAKNVDGATVAYFEMTVSCTTCHKYLRGTRPARMEKRNNGSSQRAELNSQEKLLTKGSPK